ncbi:hypothetical protein [Candidatus Venteria ishoeyi]|uniref:hypothetical protein n=1 Tax=Candidatus Venteria ishoeyi TaxID=1899563 RepID=UPI0015AE5FAF|nr:hypothetical protein [Candidatus Venteria ishoeyi]
MKKLRQDERLTNIKKLKKIKLIRSLAIKQNNWIAGIQHYGLSWWTGFSVIGFPLYF